MLAPTVADKVLHPAVTFYRYRKIEKVTRDVVQSEDSIATRRQHRVRKKLYFMTLCVIIVVLPITMFLFSANLRQSPPRPLKFDAVHFGPDPFNIYFISFVTSDLMNWVDMGHNFLAEVAGIAIFIPFGTTTEALNMYRKCFLAIGLGHIFPKLRHRYQPRPGRSRFTWWSSLTRSIRGKSFATSRCARFPPSFLP